MQSDILDHVKSLHTAAIDARNGYDEALHDADRHGMTALFRDMIALHQGHADRLAQHLIGAGEKTDDQGSFMSTVHRTIMSIRSLFGGLDESVLPGLIDGEERNRSSYDEALALNSSDTPLRSLLTAQRNEIETAVASMRERKQDAR